MAFDLDGTILFADGIRPADADAVARWRSAGNLAVTATGKSIAAARFALGGTGLEFDYHVLNTGCVIADADYRVIEADPLDTAVVTALADELGGAEGVNLYATTLDTRDLILHNGVGEATTSILVDNERLDVADIPKHEFVGAPIWVPGDPERMGRIEKWVGRFPGASAVRNQDFLDVMPAGTGKGVGIDRLIAHLDIDPVVYTVGDSWNDIGMHRRADHAACFDYSPGEVKEVCGTVTGSVAEFIDAVLAQG